MSEPDDVAIDTPPEGAACAEHPERDAVVTCPRCGSYCCLGCWHNSVRRCHACLLRDPGPVVPWEDRARSLPARFFTTLADAFRPTRSAPTFVRSEWRAALPFAAITFVPLALIAGIIPYTHTLVFGAGAVRLQGAAEPDAIALDVARAAALGFAIALVKLLCIAMPYHSLSRAYASPGSRPAALSVVLYRGWLIPLAELLLGLLAWGMPLEASEATIAMAWAVSLVPLLVLISSMLAAARMASGVGPVVTLVIVLVPFILMMVLAPLGMQALEPWMPAPPASPTSVLAS